MNKFAILAGMTLIAASSAALAQPGNGPRREAPMELTRQQVIERTAERFARLDLNSDGRVTADEGRQARARLREQRAGQMFDRLDLDHNGSIARAEFDQARAQLRERRAERRGDRGERRAEAGQRGGGRFMRRAHRGHAMRGGGRMMGEQGFITREQFQERALTRFDRLDADRNGTVTVAERRQSMAQWRERRQEIRTRD